VPVDLEKAIGAEVPPETFAWDPDRVILYHLGLGAGFQPTDERELEYVYEKRLKVLPSFGVLPGFRSVAQIACLPGLEFNPTQLLHGEQDLEILKPIPIEGEVETRGLITGVYDMRRTAVVILEQTSRDASGEALLVNRFSLFMRGEGGFGGPPAPRSLHRPPAREPDWSIESPTLSQQALIYRLSGDKNPLHADPAFARLGGFDTPILHGLCSFGIVCKAAVDGALDGATGRVARYRGRFAGVVFPGETLVTSIWRVGGLLVLEARTRERASLVITRASIELRD
jgi:acyl dehydratase